MNQTTFAWSAALILSVGGLSLVPGCRSSAPPEDGGTAFAATKEADTSTAGFDPARVQLPPGVDESELAAFTGSALERAKRPLSRIVQEIPPPDYLAPAPGRTSESTPAKADADQADDSGAEDEDTAIAEEPDTALQRAYVAGRLAIFDGNAFEASRQLETALSLAPDNPKVLRLLGLVLTASGNKVRGARYLQQAVQNDPADLESLYLLGRFAMEQEDWARAVALLHRLLDRDDAGSAFARDAALAPLSHYHLAGALAKLGDAAAAAEQYRAFYDTAEDVGSGGSRYGRELAFLQAQDPATRQAIGDLYLRLGDLEQARSAYAQAAEEIAQAAEDADADTADSTQAGPSVDLVNRQVYTDLKLSDPASAQQRVVRRVRDHGADHAALELVGYVQRYAPDPGPLADALREVYREQDESPDLAIALAELMPPDRAQDFLVEHLKGHPEDTRVYQALLTDHLLPPGRKTHPAQDVARAIEMTTSLMAAAPPLADRYAVTLLRASSPPGTLEPGFARLSPAQREEPNTRVLSGMNLAMLNRTDPAVAELDGVLNEHPDLQIARIERAKLAISQDDFSRAQELLQPLKNSTDPIVVALRVRVMTQLGELKDALALLDRAIRQEGPASLGLIMQKARLQLGLNHADDAEQTLLDALNAHPTNESIYALLFNIYDNQPGMAKNYQRLMQRVLRTIPNSRIARYKLAEWHAVKREFPRAQAMLQQLLNEQPMDAAAIGLLTEVYARSGQAPKADALIQRKLSRAPRDRKLLTIARQFYHQQGDRDKLYDVTERLLLLQPPSFARTQTLCLIYFNTERFDKTIQTVREALGTMDDDQISNPVVLYSLLWRSLLEQGEGEQAVKALGQGIQRFPQQANELRYQQAALVDRLGEPERAAKLMRQILENDPNHAAANNGLAYSYAIRNVQLDRALTLVDKALATDPNSAAFLDTKGWVLYKLGRFDEAEQIARKALASLTRNGGGRGDPATRAVLSDHLGDVLYRRGKHDEAIKSWQTAQELSKQGLPGGDPEVKNIGQRVSQKIQAAQADEEPPLAALPAGSE